MVLNEKGALTATTLFPAGQAARAGSQSAVTRQKYLPPEFSVSLGITSRVGHLTAPPVVVQVTGAENLVVAKLLSSLISTVKPVAHGAGVQLTANSPVGRSVLWSVG